MKNKNLRYYQNNALSLVERYESANVKKMQQYLLKTFDVNTKLLEIGCGSGRDASFMINNGYDIVAIDGSENMIDEAKKIHPELSDKLFHKILPYNLVFDQKFDGIYSIATLMHLVKDDIEKVISKIYDLLTQKGLFLMSISLFRDDVDKNGYDKKGRFFLILTKKEWISLCQKKGFKIHDIIINSDGLNRDNIEWLTLVMEK